MRSREETGEGEGEGWGAQRFRQLKADRVQSVGLLYALMVAIL
jgi:hypothetical protein